MSFTYTVPYGFYGAPITNRLPNKAANSACNYYVDLRNQISYPNTLGNVVVTSVNSDYINAGSLTIVSLGSSGSVAGFNISNGTEAVNYYIKASCPIITPTNTVVETYNVEFTLPVGIRTSAYDKLILEGDVTGIGLGIVQTTLSNSAISTISNIVTAANPIVTTVINLSSAELSNLSAFNPIEILSPPGDNKAYLVKSVTYNYQFGTAPYTTQGSIGFYYGANATQVSSGYGYGADNTDNDLLQYSTPYVGISVPTQFYFNNSGSAIQTSYIANCALYLWTSSYNGISGGDGSYQITLSYTIIDL